ncbi:hypothetical protein BpHYR1_053076 [Brachionus plicatilis]|uniref:Uncharacterized protein n=1 Tax=Brachionus plicatilis TaxID=10195 RepID=A0A3M7PP90_BRAPC|nr:hypothetical protein BpHYR1_053076 [Brachionus plicatilis]
MIHFGHIKINFYILKETINDQLKTKKFFIDELMFEIKIKKYKLEKINFFKRNYLTCHVNRKIKHNMSSNFKSCDHDHELQVANNYNFNFE